MLTDSAATAIQTLEAALTMEPGGLMLVKTQWYLALAHLKAGEIKKTLALLEIIAVNNTEAFYREKALKMIRQLTKDI